MNGVDLGTIKLNNPHPFWNGRRFIDCVVTSVKMSGIVTARYPDGKEFSAIPYQGDMLIVDNEELNRYKLNCIGKKDAYPLKVAIFNHHGTDVVSQYVVAENYKHLDELVGTRPHLIEETNVEPEEVMVA